MAAATYTFDADPTADVVTPTSIALGYRWTASASRWVGVGAKLTGSDAGIKVSRSEQGGGSRYPVLPAITGLRPGTTYSLTLVFETNDDEPYSGNGQHVQADENHRVLGEVVVEVTTPN